MNWPLLELAERVRDLGYQFTTVTPETHRIVNSRPRNWRARNLRDVFGWSRPFEPELLPKQLFDLMTRAEVCEQLPDGHLWRSKVRFSSTNDLLFAHSAYPTTQADAVTFGPDSLRFVLAVERHAPRAKRVVDIGCGSGVGGIVLGKRGVGGERLVLADINERALSFARVNAALAGVQAEVVQSDVLSEVSGDIDLIIANPPYLLDDAQRQYRHGGGMRGEGLSTRITREALHRLADNPSGGTLLLYTGSAIVDGVDSFFESVRTELAAADVRYRYEELDPDVFAKELANPAYLEAERIAVVFLQVHVAARAPKS